MGTTLRRWAVVLALAALLLVPLGIALAQSGGGYDLTWNTVDGGGYTFSTGGGYSLGGTIGQADAGGLTSGSYTLAGGFWSGAGAAAGPEMRPIYLPVILKGYP